jgi:hypothetical protein
VITLACARARISHIQTKSMGPNTNDPVVLVDGQRRVFWSMAVATGVSAWIACSEMLWPHSAANTVLALAAGLLGWTFSLLAIARPRYHLGVGLVGAAFALSVIFFPSDRATAANQAVSGVALLILGLFNHPGIDAPPSEAQREHPPLSVEARRFFHGLGWGAAATVAMGAATALTMAVGLWPLDRPLSMLVAHRLVGDPGPVGTLLVVAVVQLAYGALCGGLLATLSEHVDMGDALALGVLRWLATQLVVMSLLGWAEFGLDRAPVLAVATAVPHLAYALTLGWLMHRDHLTGDVPGHEPALATR